MYLRLDVIKLATEKPALRSFLVPVLRKHARCFPNNEAMQKHFREHPNAQKELHHVCQDGGHPDKPEEKEPEKAPAQTKKQVVEQLMSAYGAHPKHAQAIHEFMSSLDTVDETKAHAAVKKLGHHAVKATIDATITKIATQAARPLEERLITILGASAGGMLRGSLGGILGGLFMEFAAPHIVKAVKNKFSKKTAAQADSVKKFLGAVLSESSKANITAKDLEVALAKTLGQEKAKAVVKALGPQFLADIKKGLAEYAKALEG